MDLEKINQVLNDDWRTRQLPRQFLFVPRSQDYVYGPVCEITCVAKSNSWTIGVRYFRRGISTNRGGVTS